MPQNGAKILQNLPKNYDIHKIMGFLEHQPRSKNRGKKSTQSALPYDFFQT